MARLVLLLPPDMTWQLAMFSLPVIPGTIAKTRVMMVVPLVAMLCMFVRRVPGTNSIRIGVVGVTLQKVNIKLLLHIPPEGTPFIVTP